MQIAVIGVGFVGLVTSAVFSSFGNEVWAINRDKKKSDQLKKGKMPFFEPNLEDLVKENVKAGRLHFTTDYSRAIPQADIVMIAVGTPSSADGQADLSMVLSAAETLAPHLKKDTIIVTKSTVPPGTNTLVRKAIEKHTKVKFHLASCPEFLREGTAIEDTLNPDRVLIGATEPTVINRLLELHRPLSGQKLVMKPESAQLSKYAGNTYLANRIIFINQIADLCDQNEADIEEVIQGMGHDQRIGLHYWYPGLGYGGSCFPKDVKEILALSRRLGQNDSLFSRIDQINETRIPKIFNLIDQKINSFKDKSVCLLGLSFKPNTDDAREAPASKIIPLLKQMGVKKINTYDPKVKSTHKDPYSAAKKTDVLILLIEWDEFKQLDLKRLKQVMNSNPVFFDTRNVYNSKVVQQAGFKYLGIGR